MTQTPLSLRKSISQSRLPVRQRPTLFSSQDKDVVVEIIPDNIHQKPNESEGQQNDNRQTSPISNNLELIQPSSILKSDKKQSRLPPGLSKNTYKVY